MGPLAIAGAAMQIGGGLFNYLGSRRTAKRIEKAGRESAAQYDPYIQRADNEYTQARGRNSLLQAARANQAFGAPGMGDWLGTTAMMGKRAAGERAQVQMRQQGRENANRLSSMEEQFSMRNFQQAQTAAARGEGLLNAQQSMLMQALGQGADYRAQGITGLANSFGAVGGTMQGRQSFDQGGGAAPSPQSMYRVATMNYNPVPPLPSMSLMPSQQAMGYQAERHRTSYAPPGYP